MKKLIRLLVKLPATPFVVLLGLTGFIVFSILLFVQWLYEAIHWDKEITKLCRDDMQELLKKWFTTI